MLLENIYIFLQPPVDTGKQCEALNQMEMLCRCQQGTLDGTPASQAVKTGGIIMSMAVSTCISVVMKTAIKGKNNHLPITGLYVENKMKCFDGYNYPISDILCDRLES